MIYLLTGQDHAAKEQKIADLKTKALLSAEALSFDYQVLHGYHLDNEDLQKALMALPVASPARVVLLRQAEELNAKHKETILQAEKLYGKTLILIMEAEAMDEKSAWLQKEKGIQKFSFKPQTRHNVFDLMREVSAGHQAKALELLDELLKSGDYPVQIVGGMVWSWRKARSQMPPARFTQGLVAFQQADLRIKRSQMRPEHALEMLIVKLSS
jgi:DNA polymerase III delta subunit